MKFFHRKAPASVSVECAKFLRFLAVKKIHRISYKKEIAVHVFEPLTSCVSITSYSTAPSVTFCSAISCEYKTRAEINAVNICKICDFSGEKNFSPHSDGSGENFLFTPSIRPRLLNILYNSSRGGPILTTNTQSSS